MATNQTQYYKLNQWEAADQVVRTDFNADNVKLDGTLADHEVRITAAQETADKAYSPDNLPYVLGTYTGDGTIKRKLELGFTPKAVLVVHYDGFMATRTTGGSSYYGGLALPGYNACQLKTEGITDWSEKYTLLSITEGGFFVNETGMLHTNMLDHLYYYIALR